MNALGNQNVFAVENMTADEISVIDCGISTGDFEVVNFPPLNMGSVAGRVFSLVMNCVRSPPLSKSKSNT